MNIKIWITKKWCVQACAHRTGILVFKIGCICHVAQLLSSVCITSIHLVCDIFVFEIRWQYDVNLCKYLQRHYLCHWCASHRVSLHDRTLIYVRIHAKTWHNHAWSIVTVLKLICSDVDRFVDHYYQSGHLFIPTPVFDQTVEFLSLRLWTLNFPFMCKLSFML